MTQKPGDKVVRVDFARRTRVDDDGVEHAIPAASAEPTPPAKPAAEPAPKRRGLEPIRDESKLACFTRMVDAGLVLVTIDARAPGVSVPAKFRGMLQLNLSFSHRFHIADFEYDDLGIRATLSFDTGDHKCIAPWSSIYAMSSEALEERRVFPESFPQELLAMLPALAAAAGVDSGMGDAGDSGVGGEPDDGEA